MKLFTRSTAGRGSEQGFKVIDLVIALAILAIASRVAVPFYDAYAEPARQAEAGADLMQMQGFSQ